MAPEEPAAALYDFLYRDNSRITSLYAQLFGGRLSSLERSDQERRDKNLAGKGSILGFGGEVSSREETQSASKSTIDPHDLIVTDTLTRLRESGKFHEEPSLAPHGSLILAQGTLIFIDHSMLQIGLIGMEAAVQADKKKPSRDRTPGLQEGFAVVKAMIQGLELPSAFALRCGPSTIIAGTIKEAGMEEPISTYYFKHGAAGLSDVYLIGIKEVPSGAFTLPENHLMNAGKAAAQHLSEMLFPPDSIRVTPIAMFRSL